jgi:hypothetical protein
MQFIIMSGQILCLYMGTFQWYYGIFGHAFLNVEVGVNYVKTSQIIGWYPLVMINYIFSNWILQRCSWSFNISLVNLICLRTFSSWWYV